MKYTMAIRENLSAIQSSFQSIFKERDDEIRGALLGILSGEHVLFLGPPGTAKTYLAHTVCKSIEGGTFYYYLLTRFTTPDEIFGPLSLKALEQDEFRRNVDGCLPTAHIALLDEIFKANSSILNSLLTILNERKFHNGKNILDVPLLSVFGASNELPEEDENLEALYDRFLFRYSVDYIQDEKNFLEYLTGSSDGFTSSTTLSIQDISAIREKAQKLPVDPDVLDSILALRKELRSMDIHISDRRWKKILHALKVAAAANGDASVNRTMLLLLQHMLWTVPDQREQIRKRILDVAVSGGINTYQLGSEVSDFDKISRSVQYSYDPGQKLPQVVACKNCNDKFDTVWDLIRHSEKNPSHKYYTNSNWQTYNATDTLRSLGMKPNTIDHSKYKMLIREYNEILEKKNRLKQSLDSETEDLKNHLNQNIWISRRDVDEILLRHEEKIRDLYTIEEKMANIEKSIEYRHKS
ncbi:AAA family ATPase [uncultured Methanofollis sp.]|uniref:AAA family ATPase n=1 Tax=uncultured Methanofollis sp. TaxID=262500 RepID=UPI00263726D2|nr:AAA family ATPase [uncultured Methanofollis sp.]